MSALAGPRHQSLIWDAANLSEIDFYLHMHTAEQLSALIYQDGNVHSMQEAQIAWQTLANQLNELAEIHGRIRRQLTTMWWQGQAQRWAAAAASAHTEWVADTALRANDASHFIQAAAQAYDTARRACVPPQLIADNREWVKQLKQESIANAVLIENLQREYLQMWFQNFTAMIDYAREVQALARAVRLRQFTKAPEIGTGNARDLTSAPAENPGDETSSDEESFSGENSSDDEEPRFSKAFSDYEGSADEDTLTADPAEYWPHQFDGASSSYE